MFLFSLNLKSSSQEELEGMANYSTAKDLLDDVLFRMGEPTDGTSDYNAAALRYLNRAYQAVWMGGSEFEENLNEDWWWLRKRATITLEHGLPDATASVTKGSTTITLNSGPNPTLSSNIEGWYFKVDEHPDAFKIVSHTSGATSATLESVYTGDTATGKSIDLFPIDYSLATDVLKLNEPMTMYADGRSDHKVLGISVENLESETPISKTRVGIPTRFAPISESSVRFNAYPKEDDLVKTDYHYIRMPADLDGTSGETTEIPRQYRRILSLMASFWLAQDKNDDRRVEYMSEARALMRKMVKENRSRWSSIGEIGHIYARTRTGRNRLNDPVLRTESGKIVG